ncbi:GNAT family N-acetyltransferase [Streptomyces clavuligerus]|uniref:Amino-acid N-acetyltransferase n=1 Tax=Streptomyces clavuligerus TaxID=1901 RepID=E2PW32_STRCL|nr:GNAT family N-acetyltransferase [Streptomyces clavuligerus]ANW17483.1 amino acid acetyltransferase [Streptomyces clavuligerus]AXU12028.1 GNAT family N-acetyltransferase [Streptomyces clavuligerus]EFG10022.1 Amino-acid N-acetyltransferase [Streptomyces clavuligerus]MBY6301884.1 GNAT family N-acetyltransferase [Streptomyces clavuligerus]QCS04809.1 GNAT family N-acetyltransferase [Streptomyces clavuligerus]
MTLTGTEAVTTRPAAPVAAVFVRRACAQDAAALHTLSAPFARSGALRERPPELYAADADDFLVVELSDGALAGCLALRDHPRAPLGPSGVLYNFCVAGHSQGRGVGSALLWSALRTAETRALRAVFTATGGGGGLFLKYGFAPFPARFAPPVWANALDPRRGSRVLARAVPPGLD